MTDEWGPWIEHDGKGCPCVGEYVQMKLEWYGFAYGIAGSQFDGTECKVGSSWHWSIVKNPMWFRVISYRIRKPRGMVILESLLADIPRVGEVDVI